MPADLRGPSTTIARVGVGLSGAGVYRVEAAGRAYVLKISGEDVTAAAWRRTLEIERRAADAGLAPRIIHADEALRAVVSAFVADRSFPALYGDPRTREAALALLGRTLRRVHALEVTPEPDARDPRELLATLWSGPVARFALPAFVGDAIHNLLKEEPPARERALVLSHNDVNPTNLVYDGHNLLLLDWHTAGPNDPFYDLAAISLFLRMDRETAERMLAAYDGVPVSRLPARFAYCRRLVAVLCGLVILDLARQGGHAGATGGETSTPSLGDFYQQLRAGSLRIATAEGQWSFGTALVKESLASW